MSTDTLTQADLIALAEFAGWKDVRLTVKGSGAPGRKPSPHGKPPGKNYEAPCNHYPTNLNACMELVEAMRRQGFVWNCGSLDREPGFWSMFSGEGSSYRGEGPTLPLAICAAVLAYLDSKEGKCQEK